MSEGSEDPATIGPFVVHRKLGEGAMGVVYVGYDVHLNRKVALKLVRKQLLNTHAVRTRMTREAQAMARLSSPYVVQVYQVGPHHDGIYVAMEYVEGVSLAAWLRAERRPWQVVLRTLCDAGRGLAAAHAAGLVHRDFKPDNVLVDASGRARVLDFGLVQSDNAAGSGDTDELMQSAPASGVEETMHSSVVPADVVDRSNVHWSVRLTQFGRAAGTPAYMSPEQHFGDPVGPFSDQFSFAITAYESLYGVRPFNGDSWDSLKAQVRKGEVPAPPADSRVPGWIFKVLLRGLAIEPDQRWPTMDAMISALERDPRKTRLRVGAVVGLLGVVSVVSYAAALRQTPDDHCGGGAQELVGVWDDARKAALSQAFAATQASFAGDVLRRVEQRLGSYSDAWIAGHRSACEANVEGRQTDHLLDLRMACLVRRRSSLAALLDIFVVADKSVVENAVQAVAALPSIAACGDAEALLDVAPPDDPQTVVRVDQLRKQLERARALENTGRYDPGLELAVKVRTEAATLGYAPLVAEAALGEGSLLMAAARPAEAQAALVSALQQAIVSDMHGTAAEAAAKRIFVLGDGLGKYSEALTTQPVAEALVRRARDDGTLMALLHNNVGTVQMSRGEFETARASYEKSIELLQARAGATDPLLAVVRHNLGNLYVAQGRVDAAREQYVLARELFTRIFGESHPLGAHPLAGLGDVDVRAGNYEAAARSYQQALTLEEAAYGAVHLYLLQPLVGLGKVHARTGDAAAARGMFERAVAIADRLSVVHPLLAEALEGLAGVTEDPTKARGLYERAVEVYAAVGGKDSGGQAGAALAAGKLAATMGDEAAAIGWFERVLALPEETKVEVRPAAAVMLAQVLAKKTEATARVCDLLSEARLSLAVGDPLRVTADALHAARCVGG